MKLPLFITISLLLFSCTPKKENSIASTNRTTKVDTLQNDTVKLSDSTEPMEDLPETYSDFYLVVVDESKNYQELNKQMKMIHKHFAIEIDTLGRFYNDKTQEIILPEDDEDEIYASSYFPRRFESKTLSIEYASFYNDKLSIQEPKSFPTEMILVAGMFYEKQSADSLMRVLKPKYSKVHIQKAKVYVGCMH